MHIKFFVPGTPVPKGSAKAFYNKRTGKAQVIQTNADRQKPWASSISYTAMIEMDHGKPYAGPIMLSLDFIMPRPKSHYGTGKKSAQIKDSAPEYCISKPDADKLLRCVKDALTGVVWNDDSQVVILDKVVKRYESVSRGTGVHVEIWGL